MDVPPAVFMPELIEAYPEAKVIVSERNVDSWYKSTLNTIGSAKRPSVIPLVFLDGFLFKRWMPMTRALMMGSFGPGFLTDEEATKKRYKELHDEVRALVPEGERRLEFQLGDGWEPLCKFLGK